MSYYFNRVIISTMQCGLSFAKANRDWETHERVLCKGKWPTSLIKKINSTLDKKKFYVVELRNFPQTEIKSLFDKKKTEKDKKKAKSTFFQLVDMKNLLEIKKKTFFIFDKKNFHHFYLFFLLEFQTPSQHDIITPGRLSLSFIIRQHGNFKFPKGKTFILLNRIHVKHLKLFRYFTCFISFFLFSVRRGKGRRKSSLSLWIELICVLWK